MSHDYETIIHAKWIHPVVPNQLLQNHSILISADGKISRILPTVEVKRDQIKAKKEYTLDEKHIVIPGFVNAHCHSAMSLLRGFSDDCQLMDWLLHYSWPAEGKWANAEFVEVGSKISISEMISCGVTTFSDMYFFPDVTAKVVDEVGLRAAIGIPVMMFPSNWASGPDEYISKGLQVFEKYKDHPRIKVVVAPHAPYTVDNAAFHKCQEFASKCNTKIHLHLHETKKEIEDHIADKTHHGQRPIERLKNLGLLTKDLIAVHMTQLTDQEIQWIAESGASVVHCPESNMKLSSGTSPINKMMKKGINICIGTDGPASNDDLDIMGELRSAALLDKLQGHDIPVSDYEFLKMATLNGAKALGLDHLIGSLELGKEADIVAVKIRASPIYNPINSLIYVGNQHVDHVWVAGKCLLDNGAHTTIDNKALERMGNEWGMTITHWDKERKKADMPLLKQILEKALHVTKDTDPTKKQEILKALMGQKDNLFHWVFFAGKGENIGATQDELNKSMADVIAAILKIEELN